MWKELLDIVFSGRCSETGVNVIRRYGNVWCPWEVGSSKEGRAGSNPVTSVLKPYGMIGIVTLAQLDSASDS